jgi:hypothetical protein
VSRRARPSRRHVHLRCQHVDRRQAHQQLAQARKVDLHRALRIDWRQEPPDSLSPCAALRGSPTPRSDPKHGLCPDHPMNTGQRLTVRRYSRSALSNPNGSLTRKPPLPLRIPMQIRAAAACEVRRRVLS